MHSELKAHPAYFEKKIVQLADNVYQAFGFAASNVYMIIGDDGLIIVDTSETTAAAENILGEFRKITDLPIKTIMYLLPFYKNEQNRNHCLYLYFEIIYFLHQT